MSDIEQFCARVRALSERTGAQPTTLSRKLLGNGMRLAELEAGKSLRVDTFARAQIELAAMEAAARRPTEQARDAA